MREIKRTTKREIRLLLLSLCLTSALAGCDVNSSAKQSFEELNQQAGSKDIDTWQTYLKVEEAASFPVTVDYFGDESYGDSELRWRFKKLSESLFLRALEQHSIPALNELFARGDDALSLEQKPKYVDWYLSAADKSKGGPGDAELLMTAGDVHQVGRWALKDSIAAIGLYIRAWNAGANDAPKRLFNVYRSLNDPINAYLWGIRCKEKCVLSSGINLEQYAQERLSMNQIMWVQKHASGSNTRPDDVLRQTRQLRLLSVESDMNPQSKTFSTP